MALLCFAQRRFDEAVAYLRVTVALEPTQAVAAVCFGQALYANGDFAASATAFEAAAALAPLNANAHQKFARARTFATMLAGRVEEALAAYPGLAGSEAEERSAILYAAFSLFSAGGHRVAAIEIGRLRLAEDPGDPIQLYLLDALCGTPHDSAPVDYLEHYFDQFAPEFDEKLVAILGYRVPQQLQALVATHRNHFEDVLDLGCGTGLAVEHLVTFGGPVTGVDLSTRMLVEASKRGLYRALVKAEALVYLKEQLSRHDLVFRGRRSHVFRGSRTLVCRGCANAEGGWHLRGQFRNRRGARFRPAVIGPLRPQAGVGAPACRKRLHRPGRPSWNHEARRHATRSRQTFGTATALSLRKAPTVERGRCLRRQALSSFPSRGEHERTSPSLPLGRSKAVVGSPLRPGAVVQDST